MTTEIIQQFIDTRGVTPCPPAPAWGTDYFRPTANGSPREHRLPNEPRPTPIQALASAKILVMLQDLAGKINGEESNGSTFRKVRHDAHRWFFNPESDFEQWCDAAGLHPGYVRQKAKGLLEKGMPHLRALPGKGVRYLERKIYRERHIMRKRVLQ